MARSRYSIIGPLRESLSQRGRRTSQNG